MRQLIYRLLVSVVFTGLAGASLPAQEVTPPPAKAFPPPPPLPSTNLMLPPLPATNLMRMRPGSKFLPLPAPAKPGQVPPQFGAPPAKADPVLPGFPGPQTNVAMPAAPLAGPAAQVTNGVGPKIAFATPIYDFGRIKSGDPVKYTYIFTNIGDQILELANVAPQCGCTAAGEWTKKVEPGNTGVIPIQFNTANYGHAVVKAITVACNDRTQPTVVLQMKGTVWKPIELVPPYTIINVLPDTPNASGVVRIVNNMEEPLAVTAPECSSPAFTATLTTNIPGKEYQLTLASVPPLKPGTIQGKVTLKSSATNAPTLDIPFWANVQAPVMVLPPQIMLPAAPIANPMAPSVTIQNNTTNLMNISDPEFNVPGAQVKIKELQPGRIFSLQVSIPPGFEVPQGQKALVTVKTTHPQFKVLEIPVVQMPKPVTPMVAAGTVATPPKYFAKPQVPVQIQPTPLKPTALSPTPGTNKVSLP